MLQKKIGRFYIFGDYTFVYIILMLPTVVLLRDIKLQWKKMLPCFSSGGL